MTYQKDQGGLGLKDLQAFNEVLLAKQVWRFITKPNILMSRQIKARYFLDTSIFKAKVKARDSWLWRSWAEVRNLI